MVVFIYNSIMNRVNITGSYDRYFYNGGTFFIQVTPIDEATGKFEEQKFMCVIKDEAIINKAETKFVKGMKIYGHGKLIGVTVDDYVHTYPLLEVVEFLDYDRREEIKQSLWDDEDIVPIIAK